MMKTTIKTALLSAACLLLVAGTASAQAGECGDVNGSGIFAMSDYILLSDYLNGTVAPPDSLHLADVDGYAGLTVGDADRMMDCLFTFCVGFECGGSSSYPTSDSQIVYVRNSPVPAGAGSHIVEVWLEPASYVTAFSFPFTYSCATSSVSLDSMTWEPTVPIANYAVHRLSSDTASQSGLIAFQTFTTAMTARNRIARLYFTLSPQPLAQQIVIDTTTVPDSHTLLICTYGYPWHPALYGTPNTPAQPPSCCVGQTGDLNGDGNRTISDLTILINFLFVTFEPLPCPAAGNTYGDDKCYLNLTDVSRLVNRLFVTFVPTDYCYQFDNFICGQFY